MGIESCKQMEPETETDTPRAETEALREEAGRRKAKLAEKSQREAREDAVHISNSERDPQKRGWAKKIKLTDK